MPLLIGIDEAGYGPNLGPLVIAVTVWEIPEEAACDPWEAFAGIVSRESDSMRRTVHVADSKAIHSSAAGIGAIERSAHAILGLAGARPTSLFSLWDELSGDDGRTACREPWFLDEDLALPVIERVDGDSELVDRWRDRCAQVGIRLVQVACAILSARRFNADVERAGTKGRVLSATSLALLRRVWRPDDTGAALVLCDRHGGRRQYSAPLIEAFPDHLPLSLEEAAQISRYRLGRGEIRFEVRSEEHLPVAAASIVAKYLREASMAAFNRFWTRRNPELRHTAGYPQDARRFLEAIKHDVGALGLERRDFWRIR